MKKAFVLLCVWAIACTSLAFSQELGDVYMWEFNEGSGTVVTDNSGQYGATLGALADLPVIETDSPSGQAGDLSIRPIGGLRVDDSDNPVLALQQGPMTAEVWVNADQLDGWRDIFRLGTSIKAGFNGENLVFTFLAVVDINTSVAVPVDGQWHHLAFAWEPEVGVSFYLDGAFAEFVEETRFPQDFQDSFLSIGSTLTGASQFLGMMDRFRIHGAVLTEDQLDSDAANPKDNLDSTIVAYGFDEGSVPCQSSTSADRPAISINQEFMDNSYPAFSSDNPKGENGDFSMSFDGTDRISYDDNQTFFFDFIDEPFTFEAWLKFRAEEQVAERPILFAYGVGGQGGYSFSFRPAPVEKTLSVDDSPSGNDGDMSILPASGLQAIGDDDASVLPGQEGPITVEAWIKPDSLDGNTDIMRIGNSIKAGFVGDQLVFTFLGIVDLTTTNTAVPVDGAWHHVAYAWEPGVRVSFYLDGALSETIDTGDTGRDYQNNNLSVGASHTGSSPFDGLIDRLRIHNATLDDTQLDSDAANPKAPLSGTVLSYPFDEAQPPYASETENPFTVDNRGNYLTVTTYGIIDAHSNAEIPDDGAWHHVASVFDWDGFAFKFYVDGELKDTLNYEDGVNFAPENEAILYMGCERGGGNPYVGLLDRVKITRATLTEADFDLFEPVSVGNWSLY